ncbi:MAG: NAD(P)H-dependent oxidoreductase [bacterium]|jgi:NAD(P)H dehydrogenase (quinone)
MNVLIVFAHPEPKSFSGALADLAVETLSASGHSVRRSDLYRSGFQPCAGAADFKSRMNPDYLQVFFEQGHASKTGTHAPDVAAEQEKLAWADLVIFHSPLWWFSVPAILKGWFDRVLAVGWAYDFGVWYDTGLMKGKKAMLALTTGGPETIYSPRGLNGDINVILWPIVHGTLQFCGFDVLEPFVAFGAMLAPEEARARYLAAYRERLLKIESAPAIPRNPLSDYDEKFELLPGRERIAPW